MSKLSKGRHEPKGVEIPLMVIQGGFNFGRIKECSIGGYGCYVCIEGYPVTIVERIFKNNHSGKPTPLLHPVALIVYFYLDLPLPPMTVYVKAEDTNLEEVGTALSKLPYVKEVCAIARERILCSWYLGEQKAPKRKLSYFYSDVSEASDKLHSF